METVSDFILGGSKITADGDCSHEIKRRLLLRGKVGRSDQPRQNVKKQRHYFVNKGLTSQVVMHGCESWTVKKLSAEELMPFNCGVAEDSLESLGLQGDPTSQS